MLELALSIGQSDYMLSAQREARSARGPSFALPYIKGLEKVPQRLRAEDEADLRWRLSSPQVTSLLGGSSMGAALERAESYGYGAIPCRTCGGSWRARRRKRDGELIVSDWRDGTGWMPKASRNGRRPTYATALAAYRVRQCRENRIVIISHHAPGAREATIQAYWDHRGEMVVTADELRDMFPRLPEEECVPCRSCQGIGVVPRRHGKHAEVTAWPKGSSVQLGGREGLDADGIAAQKHRVRDAGVHVDLEALNRFKNVEEILQGVCELAPIARVALEEYYSPGRDPWERLTPLTRTGSAHRRGPESLWSARVASEAAELYSFACGCWNLVAYGAGS